MEHQPENAMQYAVEEWLCPGDIMRYSATVNGVQLIWTDSAIQVDPALLLAAMKEDAFQSAFETLADIHRVHRFRVEIREMLAGDGHWTPEGVWERNKPMAEMIADRILKHGAMYEELLVKLDPADLQIWREAMYRYANFGYVYLVKADNGLWKIGHSVEPVRRISGLGVLLPYELTIDHLIICLDRIAAESAMHKRYAHCRVRGEWFALTDQDIADIKAIKEL